MRLFDPTQSTPTIGNGPRHAGAHLVVAGFTRQPDGVVPVRCPASCAVRLVRIAGDAAPAPLAGGLRHLYQLEPLPFTNGLSLRHMRRGIPTFYIGWEDMDTSDVPEGRLAAGDQLGVALEFKQVYIGVLFQDGVSVWPWDWIEEIGQAMTDAGETTEADAWNQLNLIYSTEVPSAYRVLDHVGRPLGDTSFEVRVAGGPDVEAVSVGAEGDLELSISATSIGTLFPDPAEPDREVRWVPGSADALALQADATAGVGALPNQWMTVPRLASRRGSLHVLDLDRWLAVPPPTSAVARIRTASRYEPIVDGHDYFRQLHADLVAAAVPPAPASPPDPAGLSHYGAHIAGFTFEDFEMLLGNEDSKVTQVLAELLEHDATFRVLGSKILQLEDDAVIARAFLVWLAISVGIIYTQTEFSDPSTLGGVFAGVAASAALAAWLYVTISNDPGAGITKFEGAVDFVDTVNEMAEAGTVLGVLSRNPAPLSANPEADMPSFLTDTLISHFGAYHQKFLVVRNRLTNPDRDGYVGYVGGMDLHKTRMSAPGHQTDDRRWHDVQARITGPAVRDLFQSFAERWDADRLSDDQEGEPLAIPTPDVASLALPDSPGHIVQIARTYYRPAAPGSGLPFAPDGENTIYDSMIHAIENAKSYIYIEDQYFTPNDVPEPLSGDSYLSALLEAADHCDRLLIVTPHHTDQPFGEERRSILASRLLDRWGARAQIVVPYRRPMLPNAGAVASKYRARLFGAVTFDQTHGLLIGPRNRIPADPGFWLWVNGELMVATNVADGGKVDEVSVALVDVARAGVPPDARWGATTRPHPKGAAVTIAGLPGIFVHSKLLIVDDLFVGIGTANLNRRGFFHDGEIQAYCVPQGLRAAASNPAKELRCALWAEHMGLPPGMGKALFADPVAAFELFRRSRYLGNRCGALLDVDVAPLFPFEPKDRAFLKWLIIGAQLVAASAVEGLAEELWHTVVDPTTGADPAPPHDPF